MEQNPLDSMDDTKVKAYDQRIKKKRKNEGINNRQKTLLNKAHELGEFEGVEVVVIVRKYGKYTTYVSEGFRSQQPSFKEIVSRTLACLRHTATLMLV